MRFYADVTESRTGLEILDELDGFAGRHADSRRATIPGDSLGIARDGLILSGMLEQALADDSSFTVSAGQSARRINAAAEAMTDWWADRLISPSAVGVPPPRPRTAELVAPSAVVVPEGYLFYALFPELYARVGWEMARESTETPYVVVGVRSIGTSLSAAFAAGLRAAGRSVTRHTVRPIGDPFSRELIVSSEVESAWREAANRGAAFVAVDEGPGLSGSSLAAAVQAFHRAGVPPDRTAIVCANPPGSLPQAGAEVRRIWQSTAFQTVGAAGEEMLSRRLPALLSSACGAALCLGRDLSWGRWREDAAPMLPLFERRKLLLRDDVGGRVLAKFVGFGAWGAGKAASSCRLAERGAAAPYRGYAHGFLLQDWVGEPLADALTVSERSELWDAAAAYYAGLRREAEASGAGMDLAGPAMEVEQMRDAWFGPPGPDDLGPKMRTAEAGLPRAFDGDQRPEPVEWRRWGNRIIKCDTADHFLDHSWARRQDIAFDLAGFIDEWQLDSSERDRFLTTYMAKSGDDGAPKRIPFFRCVYQAHRLAMYDTAYHADMDVGDGSIARKRQSIGVNLAAALATPAAALCD